MRDVRALVGRLEARLGGGFLPGLGLVVAAVAATQIVYLPYIVARVREVGLPTYLPHWALHRMLPSLFVAFVAFLALRMSTRSAAEMVARPRRFVMVLIGSGSVALLLVWALALALDPPANAEDTLNDEALIYLSVMGLLYAGSLFGWFYFLILRRREDGTRLSMMLGRHALLKRQVAQSRLVVARAQIDPAMVARVLRAVQARAETAHDDGAAAALIDQLASYLRLALDRVHGQAPSLASDLALVRSLAALRQAETGTPIDLQIITRVPGAGRRPANEVFLITRAMLDAALQHAPRRIELRLVTHDGGLAIDVIRDGPVADDDSHARLTASLAALLPGLATLRHTTDTGLQRHAAHVPLD